MKIWCMTVCNLLYVDSILPNHGNIDTDSVNDHNSKTNVSISKSVLYWQLHMYSNKIN